MGAAIRAHDWSGTPVGPRAGWPPALCNALNLILNSQESLFLMWGPERTFFFNDAYRPLLGPRLPVALGSDIAMVWADTWDQVLPVVERALSGEGTRFENVPLTMARYGAPEQTWWTFSFSPLYDDSGAIAGMLGITRETTDHVLATHRVKADHAALTQMFEQAPSFIAILRGAEHRFELANRAYMKLIGHRPVLGRTVAEALPDAAAQGYVALLDHVHASGETFSAAGSKYAVQAVPGGPLDERYLDFVFQPITDPAGGVTGIFVEGYDVTERRIADERLRRLNESLEAEVQIRTAERDRTWRLSPDLFAVVAADGAIAAVNPAWTSLLGWEERDLVGRDVATLTHPDDVAAVRAGLSAMFEGRAAGQAEYRLRHRDGSDRWFSWTGALEAGLVYASGRHVTAQRAQAVALAMAEEALRQSQKLEAVGQLTGGVAHDFNNILTIIRSSVDFLRRPDLPDERRRRYMDAVSETVDRGAKLTGQLLAFARRQALTPEVFDAGERVRAIADMIDTLTGARVRVVVHLPETPCHVRADVSQFETALINMAVNARDAMEGEGTLTLRLDGGRPIPSIRGHAGSPRGFAAVSLGDTGTGIAPDRIERIFEPFFTTKEVGKGTGLGLSQVFGFAKQSGGDVAVASVPGQGTTFTLYLPEVDSPGKASSEAEVAGARPAPTRAWTEEAARSAGAGERILVVEDNLEVGRFATQILDDLGYRTVWAVNAEEALDRLGPDGAGFDAVFSDVVMPGMGGIALAKLLQVRMPHLPVILASGYSSILAQEGTHGFPLLHKPYSAEQLARILGGLIADIEEPDSSRAGTGAAIV